jgi:hypothetical protein
LLIRKVLNDRQGLSFLLFNNLDFFLTN